MRSTSSAVHAPVNRLPVLLPLLVLDMDHIESPVAGGERADIKALLGGGMLFVLINAGRSLVMLSPG
jgi:hypothetical protein